MKRLIVVLAMAVIVVLLGTSEAAVDLAAAFVPHGRDASSRHHHRLHHSDPSSTMHSRCSCVMAATQRDSINDATASASSSSNSLLSLDALRTRSVKELKKELQDRHISSSDLFEKEQLVLRLYNAILNHNGNGNDYSASAPEATYTTRRCRTRNSTPRDFNVIETPLKLQSLRGDDSFNNRSNSNDILFQPTDQPFCLIDLQCAPGVTLTLMVDTACSGIVLQPRAVQKLGLRQQQPFSSPVTSTGASGTAESVGLAEIPNFVLGGQTFAPMPAAVQTVDSLPDSIDGIIGLAFLGQFDTVEFDYAAKVLRLYRDEPPSMSNSDAFDGKVVVAQGPMRMLGSLGIYVVDVLLGGRGPVSMVVDTGGSNTFLNWKGVADLGLGKESRAVSCIAQTTGARGNTAQFFDLTHRIHVSSHLKLYGDSSTTTKPQQYDGLSLAGPARLAIDIGDIPILQMMATSQNVGGILGLDVFTRCKAIRVKLKGRERTLTLLQ